MHHEWIGRIGYADALERMKGWVNERASAHRPDTLFTLEHPPVVTYGKSASLQHLLASPERLAQLGVELHETTRGGDITFHGPGQLVGYGIVDLRTRGLGPVAYMRILEEACIRAAAAYGIEGHRREGKTGVWTEKGKLVAMGVRFERGVTSHGFAFNVRTNLDFFRLIVPCGLAGEPVASMDGFLEDPPDLETLGARVAQELGRALQEAPPTRTPRERPSLEASS